MVNSRQVLQEYFNIIEVFDLNHYSRSMGQLHGKLSELKKKSFTNKDRIIFTLFDHDFYFDNRGPGWTLYNLQLILTDLDIPNFFCLLLTNQPDYQEFSDYVQRQLTTDPFPIRTITTLLAPVDPDWFPDNVARQSDAIDQIEKPYCLLSRQSRPHRTFFMAKLFESDLLEHGIVGYNNILHPAVISKNNVDIVDDGPRFSFLEIPVKDQNLILRQPHNRKIFKQFDNIHPTFKNFVENSNIEDKNFCISLSKNVPPIKKGFLYVGLETQVLMPRPHVSIISLRGILERRPFVLFSAPNTLKFLKDRGFKTFSAFWDESYDEITDIELRVEKIIEIVQYISSMPKNELIELYQKIEPITTYNHDFYHDGLMPSEQALLRRACEKNLSPD